MQRLLRDSLVIRSNRPTSFLSYLLELIKKELEERSRRFNSSFLYYGTEVTLESCIESLTADKGKIYFRMEEEVRYLIFNNRQLFWYDTIQTYRRHQNALFLRWKGMNLKRKIKS